MKYHLAKRTSEGKADMNKSECFKNALRHNVWILKRADFQEVYVNNTDNCCTKCAEVGLEQNRLTPIPAEIQAKKADLIQILKRETASLKNQYMEMTGEWASKNYDRLKLWVAEYLKQMHEFRLLDPATKQEKRKEYQEKYKLYNSLPYDIVNPNGLKTNYVISAMKKAEHHYEDSIKKLAYRIKKKNFNEAEIKVKTSHVGVNIDTVLTDGVKTVHAFTIIASGPIQRPHYRYLIK